MVGGDVSEFAPPSRSNADAPGCQQSTGDGARGHLGAQEMSTLRLTELQEQLCSKASIEQRKGRAGRVQPGICIRMVSRKCAEKQLLDNVPAEMDILPLENMLLQVLVALQPGSRSRVLLVGESDDGQVDAESQQLSSPDLEPLLRDCLRCAASPPAEDAIRAGLRELTALGAIESVKVDDHATATTSNRRAIRVTGLGRHLARLSCDVRIGKLLIYGAILGCPREAASLAAMLSVRNPLLRPRPGSDSESWERLRQKFRRAVLRPGGARSDHCMLAALLDIYNDWESPLCTLASAAGFVLVNDLRQEKSWLNRLGVSLESLKEAAKLQQQHLSSLRSLGFSVRSNVSWTTTTTTGSNKYTIATFGSGTTTGTSSITTTTTAWYMLRAACVAAFFLVKAKKPQATYKKLAGGGTIQEPLNPAGVKYFPLQRDPFLFKDKIVDPKNPFGTKDETKHANTRFFLNGNCTFFSEAPNGNYMVHTDVFGSRDKLFLEHVSEAAPLAVLLLGNFETMDFLDNGVVVIDNGKLVYTTTGVYSIEDAYTSYNNKGPGENSSSSRWTTGGAGAGSSSKNAAGASMNTFISQLVEMLREEIQENVLRRKIEDPSWDVSNNAVVQVVKTLLGTDGMGC
ncbi:unnamed protein product [Amoebophrya sp. A25]|nr:unnamed protein product [Amoebophrya sp. A25]|eukprot:GSA25T00014042001.1